jgi:hypothetical protein
MTFAITDLRLALQKHSRSHALSPTDGGRVQLARSRISRGDAEDGHVLEHDFRFV